MADEQESRSVMAESVVIAPLKRPLRLFSVDRNQTLMLWPDSKELLAHVESEDVGDDEYEVFDEKGCQYNLALKKRRYFERLGGQVYEVVLERGDLAIRRAAFILASELNRLGQAHDCAPFAEERGIASLFDQLQAVKK